MIVADRGYDRAVMFRNLSALVPAIIALIAGFAAPATAAAFGASATTVSGGPPGHLLGDDVVRARLILARGSVASGGSVIATLELAPAAGWHLYGPEHGDAGLPPDITWTLPASVHAGAIHFPQSTREVRHGLTTFEYAGPVALRVRLSASAMAAAFPRAPLRADVSWLVCSHVCAPGRTTLTGTLDIIPVRRRT